jgi:glucokinase
VIVGVDIGGTTMLAVLLDADGRVIARAEGDTPAAEGAVAVLDRAATLVATCDPQQRHRALGVGAPGVIDPHTGTVLAATDSIHGWAGTPIATGLAQRVGTRSVHALNDVHAFAVGEWRRGAAHGAASVLAITLGTGVGGAVITDGRLLLGHGFAAGHLGHVPVAAARGRACPCGSHSHVEAVAGAPGVVAAARAAGLPCTSVREVAEAAHAGDTAARNVLAATGQAVGEAVAGAVNLVAPDVVVVGGGVARAGDLLLRPLRATVQALTLPTLANVPVVTATLGVEAVAVGAALAARLATELAGLP